jgi:hypothetical protein
VTGVTLAPLRDHVMHIVFRRSNEQVRRVTTRSIVALVTYVKSWRNWPVSQFVRQSVCAELFPEVGGAPVSRFLNGPGPGPTSFRSSTLVHSIPEPFSDRDSLKLSVFTLMSSHGMYISRKPNAWA